MRVDSHYDVATDKRIFVMYLYRDTDPGNTRTFIKARLDDVLVNKTTISLRLQIHKEFLHNVYCENICHQLVDFWLVCDQQRARDFYALCKEKGFIP